MCKPKKIAITVGHSFKSGGAVGSAGLSEWNFNNQLALDVYMQLDNPTLYRVFYRDELRYIPAMNKLHKEIDEWGAKIDIEMHFNASRNKDAEGSEVLYRSQRGKIVAQIIQNKIVQNLVGTVNRGVKQRLTGRGSYGLKIGKSISVIVEPFFAEEQRFFDYKSENYKNLVSAYVEAIQELQTLEEFL